MTADTPQFTTFVVGSNSPNPQIFWLQIGFISIIENLINFTTVLAISTNRPQSTKLEERNSTFLNQKLKIIDLGALLGLETLPKGVFQSKCPSP
jgi:hypothetical protein